MVTANKQRALTALLTSKTRVEAAEKAGLDPRTLRRYFETDREFAEAYRRELSKLIDDAAAQAKLALSPTLSTLQDITADTDQPGNVRVSAGRAVLEFALRLIEQADVVSKLDALEGQLMGGGENNV